LIQPRKQKPEVAGSNGDVQASRTGNDVLVVGPGAPTANFKIDKLDSATAPNRVFPSSPRCLDGGDVIFPILVDPRHVDVRNEIAAPSMNNNGRKRRQSKKERR
jgi:hypothetical protein